LASFAPDDFEKRMGDSAFIPFDFDDLAPLAPGDSDDSGECAGNSESTPGKVVDPEARERYRIWDRNRRTRERDEKARLAYLRARKEAGLLLKAERKELATLGKRYDRMAAQRKAADARHQAKAWDEKARLAYLRARKEAGPLSRAEGKELAKLGERYDKMAAHRKEADARRNQRQQEGERLEEERMRFLDSLPEPSEAEKQERAALHEKYDKQSELRKAARARYDQKARLDALLIRQGEATSGGRPLSEDEIGKLIELLKMELAKESR
jgi:hypothetical protein